MIQPRFLEIDGRRLAYVDEGDGPALVLIHGASGNLNDWMMGPAAALDGYRIIAFDRPGLGRSDPAPEPLSLASQAAVMEAGLARLGVARAILVGQSYGGAVALSWAITRPARVAGLVLAATPSISWPGGVGPLYNTLASPVIGHLASHILPRLASDRQISRILRRIFKPQMPPQGYRMAMQLDDFSFNPAILRRNAGQLVGLKAQVAAMMPHYPDLAMPVHLIHGDADTIVAASYHLPTFTQARPQTTVTRLPGIGHMLHHARPDALRDAIDTVAAASDCAPAVSA